MASCPLFFAHSRNTVSISRRRTKAATLLGLYRSLPLSSPPPPPSFLSFVRVLSVQKMCRFQVLRRGRSGEGGGGGVKRGRKLLASVLSATGIKSHLWRPKRRSP